MIGVPAVHSNRAGTFVRVDGIVGQAGLPVYRNDDNQYLYFWEELQAWGIGKNHTSNIVGMHSNFGENSTCPTDVGGWHVLTTTAAGSEIVASGLITATCGAYVTVVQFE